MRTQIIKIGNSKGVRIPKPLLEECHFDNDIEIISKDDEIIIRAVKSCRHGWKKAFQSMSENNDDQLVDSSSVSDWDKEEWEWK